MDHAADALTSGEGLELLSQSSVQRFLWLELPRTWPATAWDPLVEATTALFEELGLHRYAAIASSETTSAVLDAWLEDPDEGLDLAAAAAADSGVEPVDTDELSWADVRGPDEDAAAAHIERALEAAIDAGRLEPGCGRWRVVAAQVQAEALAEPMPGRLTQTWATAVTTERVEHWIATSATHRQRSWRERIANQVLSPPDPPADPSVATGPMLWLLTACRDGAALTATGYLSPALVRDAVSRFPWWWPYAPADGAEARPPRSEADVAELGSLREVAARLRLVRRRGRELRTTRAGAALIEDPVRLWRLMASTLAGNEFEATVAELAAARLLGTPDGALGPGGVEVGVAEVAGQGWRTSEGPLTREDISWALTEVLRWWWVLGLLDAEGEPGRSSLTPAGRATVLAFLHGRATGPHQEL